MKMLEFKRHVSRGDLKCKISKSFSNQYVKAIKVGFKLIMRV